ncbi:MAG: helix-turn-helix transcriptional regulator [Actinomycetota bacterium]|nr:helix-turn-helix transcriptional regulator [Actinomycetota bacterium]
MSELSASDLEGVLLAARSVSTAREPSEFNHLATEQVARLLPSEVVTFNEIDPATGTLNFLSIPSSYPIPPGVEQHLIALADQHPLIDYYIHSSDGSAKKISDFWSQAEFRASALYELVYQPMQVEFQMSITLRTLQSNVVAIVANRSHVDFSERDRTVLNTLRPHLVQAWYSARDHHRLRMLLNSTIGALVESEVGLIVLSDPPQELTAGTLATLYRHFGPPADSSPWPIQVEQWIFNQRSRFSSSDGVTLLSSLRVENGGRRMTLRYLDELGESPGAVLLQEQTSRPTPQDLGSLGLSVREAEVTAFVISGATNASIADAMFIAPATVKRHLENVYAKLGVKSRGELAAFVHDVLDRQLL